MKNLKYSIPFYRQSTFYLWGNKMHPGSPRITQVVERWPRNPEVRGSNPGSGSNFPLVI